MDDTGCYPCQIVPDSDAGGEGICQWSGRSREGLVSHVQTRHRLCMEEGTATGWHRIVLNKHQDKRLLIQQHGELFWLSLANSSEEVAVISLRCVDGNKCGKYQYNIEVEEDQGESGYQEMKTELEVADMTQPVTDKCLVIQYKDFDCRYLLFYVHVLILKIE